MQALDRVDPAKLRALLERREFFWLDLLRPSDEELDTLADALGFAPFAVEDDKEFRQRPKVDDYGERAFLVFYGADDTDQPVEVHVHVSGDYVVTIRRRSCRELDRPREAVAAGKVRSELDLVFRILDALADSVAKAVERMGARVAGLQEQAFDQPHTDVRREIAALRGELFRFQQLVEPQAAMLASDGKLLARLPGLESDRARHPFREVHDVLVSTDGRIEYLREMLAEAVGIYLSSNANRLNRLATRLAILGTIFLPLTFVTGFFGQNFKWLVDHIQSRHAFLLWTVGPTTVVIGIAVALALLSARRR